MASEPGPAIGNGVRAQSQLEPGDAGRAGIHPAEIKPFDAGLEEPDQALP